MLLPIALGWILGLLYAGSVGSFAKLVLATLTLGLASLLVVGGDALGSRLWGAPLAGLALLAGLGIEPVASPPLLARGLVDAEATIESESVKPDRRDVIVRVERREAAGAEAGAEAGAGTGTGAGAGAGARAGAGAGAGAGARAGADLVWVPEGTRLRVPDVRQRVGARIRLRGELVPSLAARNPSPHPPWPEARATAGIVPVRATRRITRRSIGMFDDAIGHARERTRIALYATLSARSAGVACALVLGDGAMLDSDDAASVRGAGLSHVLAVSGTHIAMVGGGFVFVVERLLRRVRRVLEPWRWAAALGIPFALLHAAYAGSVPSGWRAAVTAAIGWALVAAGRRPDALETTAAATLVLSLPCPSDATRPGFLLSVLATVAVITAPRPTDESLRQVLLATWSMTWRCAAATAPIVIYVFGDVPLASLAANVVLVPLGSIALLPVSLVHTGVALVVPSLAEATAAVFEPASNAFLEGSRAFAAIDDGMRLPPPTALQALVLTAAATMVVARLKPPLGVAALLTVVYLADEARVRARPFERDVLALVQLDVGQGDAAMLTTPDGHRIVVDFGPNAPDAGERILVPLLRAFRWSAVDLAVLTHRHPDHYGGLATVGLELPIRELWEPGEFGPGEARHETEAWAAEAPLGVRARGDAGRAIEALRGRGTRVVHPGALCGRARRFGRVTLRVVSPCPGPEPRASLNDNSIVLRVEYGRRAFLLAGDAERATETRLVAEHAALRADFVKLGHHGSRTSTTPAFLRAVHPRYGLVSAGPGNRFGHPHAETLATLRSEHVPFFRTDRHGGVRVTTNGAWLRVAPFVP